jgi:hypothetical protein
VRTTGQFGSLSVGNILQDLEQLITSIVNLVDAGPYGPFIQRDTQKEKFIGKQRLYIYRARDCNPVSTK